jgi:MFS transporter, putative metabolite:H+ symporter
MVLRSLRSAINLTVIVGSLGYFVDMYDLLLYGIVRVQSLTDLGVTGAQLVSDGIFLLNMQMAGMLIGGIVWGILGDKRGRISVLFGSILMYSIANVANAYVASVPQYALARFCAGMGLAGELGAAITLVSEALPQEIRGYGTTIVASVGIMGSVVAALVGDLLPWRTAYLVGGGIGMVLLVLRMRLLESPMFDKIKKGSVRKGDFVSLFTSRTRFLKYLRCILIGVPTWFVVGVLVTFSPEFARLLGVEGPISAGRAILFTYLGLVVGDFSSGFISQMLKSRKRIVYAYVSMTFVFVLIYLFGRSFSVFQFYSLCTALGIGMGYWAVFVTIASEQFGTNLRSTVLITLSFHAVSVNLGFIHGALLVGAVCFGAAFWALYFMEETFHKDLNYVEEG